METSNKAVSKSTDLRNHFKNTDTSNLENFPRLFDSSDEVKKNKQVFSNRASGETFIDNLLNDS